MNSQDLREKLPDIIDRLQEINLVYLFGSQIESHLGPMSDCDLAILLDRDAELRQAQARFSHELACAMETDRVDVVLLNRAPVELAYAVVAQGELLYQRDLSTRVEYEAQVMSRYGDYSPVLRAQFNDVLRGDENATRIQRYRAAFGRTERTLGQIAAAQRKEPN